MSYSVEKLSCNTLGSLSVSRSFGWVLLAGVVVSRVQSVHYYVNNTRSTSQVNILGSMNNGVVVGEFTKVLNSARRLPPLVWPIVSVSELGYGHPLSSTRMFNFYSYMAFRE